MDLAGGAWYDGGALLTVTTRCHSLTVGCHSMALLAGDWVQVSFIGACFNQVIELVRVVKCTQDFPIVNNITTDLTLIRTAVRAGGVADWETPYLAALPPQYQLNEVRTQRIWPARSAFFGVAVANPGTNANAATVACDSAAITFRTDKGGRNQLSIVKVGPCPDGASAAGLITNAYRALLVTLATALGSPFTPPTSGCLMIPIVPHVPTHTDDQITNFLIGTQSRVMSRRVVGRGI